MGGAAIEPDVEHVHDHLIVIGIIGIAEITLRGAGLVPGIGALCLEGLSDTVVDRLVAEDVACLLVHEDGDRHAPGALAAEHPIGAVGNHGAQAVLPGGGVEFGGVDGGERTMAQRVAGHARDIAVHIDEPLRRVAIDHRFLGAPGMGILVLHPATGDDVAGLGQSGDDAGIGVALLAVVVDDARTLEAGGVLGVEAGIVHGIGDGGVNVPALQQAGGIHPDAEVVQTMAGRGVNEAGARVIGDVFAIEQGHVEGVAAGKAAQGMGAGGDQARIDIVQPAESGDLGLGQDFGGQIVGQDIALAHGSPIALGRLGDLIEAIGDAARIADGAIGRDGPGCGGPDDHESAVEAADRCRRVGKACCGLGVDRGRRAQDREFHPDRVALIVLVFDLGLGQRRALDHRPHDGLAAAIELAGGSHLHQLAGDLGLSVEAHGKIGIVPLAQDPKALELGALHVDPVLGEGAAFLAEFDYRNLVLVLALGAVLLLDLPFDGQAMAVPARHIGRVEAQHLHGARHQILQRLVERVADMDVAIGVGRAVMDGEERAILGLLALQGVNIHFLPALEPARLALGQAGAHGEIGFRQKQGGRIIGFGGARGGVGHGNGNR